MILFFIALSTIKLLNHLQCIASCKSLNQHNKEEIETHFIFFPTYTSLSLSFSSYPFEKGIICVRCRYSPCMQIPEIKATFQIQRNCVSELFQVLWAIN